MTPELPQNPPLPDERLHTEALVEAFVAAPGLGSSRLRSVQHGSALDLGETLRLLCAGDSSCFPRRRRRGDAWDELAGRFHDVCAAGVAPASTRWWIAGDPSWDDAFGSDDEPPAALAYVGSLEAIGASRVAIVGLVRLPPLV